MSAQVSTTTKASPSVGGSDSSPAQRNPGNRERGGTRPRGGGGGRNRGAAPRGGKPRQGRKKDDDGEEDKEEGNQEDEEQPSPDNAAQRLKGLQVKDEFADERDDSDLVLCHICTEPIKYFSVAECNHRTCHVCTIRLRALYKKTDCVMCKEVQNVVIFTTSLDAPFSSFQPESIPYKDSKLSVYFESQEMMEDTLILLRFNCPDSECDFIANGWADLRLHVRATHGKLMCDICIRSKKVFAHEHTLYPPNLLPIHLPSMHQRQRNTPKELPEGGIHPLCQFCRECFFGDDELYAHMREMHEECFVCKRNDVRHQYFQNYESMERHFNTAHHPCTHQECLARKFVVFNTALDLKAHMVEEHGGDMSSRDRKDVRRIQADFAFEDTGRHGRRDREREREREREPPPPPPPPQPQPPRQQQAAPSRPGPSAAPGASRRKDAFGSALTTDDANNRIATRPVTPPADVDPEAAERHAAFLTRLRTISAHPDTAVAAVKAAARGYRTSETSARDFILTVWNVLDRNLEHTASIVNAFVDLLEDEEKKTELLASWKGFNIEQRRQFPELVPSGFGSEYAGITSGRVLNAKHATASRSPSHQTSQRVWDRVARAASSSAPLPPAPTPALSSRPALASGAFPALPGTSSPAVNPTTSATPFRQPQRNTPWVSSSAASPALKPPGSATFPTLSQPVSINTPTPKLSKSVSKGARQPPPKISEASFPGLPTNTTTRSKPTVSGNVSLKNILGSTNQPNVSAWSASGGGNGSGGTPPPPPRPPTAASIRTASEGGLGDTEQIGPSTGAGAQVKSKKSKGKQKQTLYTLGSFPT